MSRRGATLLKDAGQELARAHSPVLQRKPAPSQRPFDGPAVADGLRSPGQPLDGETRVFMESRFGYDFSRVRVHADERASRSATGVNARAYTVGQNIAFK